MPNNKYNVGDTVYFVESQRIIRKVKIIKCGGGFYTMKFVDCTGGIRLRENRLFGSKEEAENSIFKAADTATEATPQTLGRFVGCHPYAYTIHRRLSPCTEKASKQRLGCDRSKI